MKILCAILAMIAALAPCPPASADGGTLARSYSWRGRGTLTLQLPADWEDQVHQASGAAPPDIVLSGFEGRPFVAAITPLWAPRGAVEFAAAKNIRALAEAEAREAAPRSAEGKLVIVTMTGGAGPGYYFEATDRAPGPGEFKYMTRGAVGVGELVCKFTILSDDPRSPAETKALTMLSRAIWRSGR